VTAFAVSNYAVGHNVVVLDKLGGGFLSLTKAA
jgi:hypothetical protein